MSSTGRELTNKRCKKCGEKLYVWWAMDIGGYECSGCGERYSIEDYWDKKIDYKLRKGTRVRIVKDAREGVSTSGKLGKLAGWKEGEYWILFGADGSPEIESYTLPEGYIEWNPEKEDFPKVKCGIRSKNPVFLLDDGSEIHGGQCWWEPLNPKIKKRIEGAYKELLRRSGEKDPRES